MGRKFQLCLLLALVPALHAQLKMTADQVVSFIRSSIQLHHDDVKVAEYVKKIKLADRLEARRVEELQGMGAGPRTIAALRLLTTASSSLPVSEPPPPPPPRPVIPPPSPAELDRILHEVIENAREYVKGLPDYLCLQVTRRHFDPTGTENWRLYDTVQEQLSYVDHHESYKVTMVNGRAVANVEHQKLGGSTLSGDFGSFYSEIFAPETETEFDWDHWATLRGKRMYVFAFRIPQSRSHFTIASSAAGGRVITAGYHGLIYADRETTKVMRYRLECDDIPPDYPIKEVKVDVNYDYVDIAGQKFVLPLKTELHSRDGRYLTWNEAEFHLYRKFGTESNIIFDLPDPIPDDKTKEEPPVPDPAPVKKPQPQQ
jgi:hypothetical protein